jgi:hypothetical protein
VADTPPESPEAPEPAVVDLDPRSVVAAMVAFAVLAALTGLVRSAPRTITWLVIGSLLALALNPLVVAVQRRVGGHRMRAVAIVLMALVLASPPSWRCSCHLRSARPGTSATSCPRWSTR